MFKVKAPKTLKQDYDWDKAPYINNFVSKPNLVKPENQVTSTSVVKIGKKCL